MDRKNAEKTIAGYLKPVLGFTLKRCKTIQDAEDLSQEIVLRAFRALLGRDDIADMDRFIWTVAHNALANYYRDSARSVIGVPLEEIAELPDASAPEADDRGEALERLQYEIAYLSKLQRRIVIAYYYENRKQTEIASELGISPGTVKWHLFEARKKLKRGMDMIRKSSELKFNPIHFERYGFAGSVGKNGFCREILRSALSQNILYSVWQEGKTISEIADELGVSPVYVESEAEYLEENGFLLRQGVRYLCNILIEEPSEEFCRMQEELYQKAAGLFANELYEELLRSELLENGSILGGGLDETAENKGKPDRNFILWTLVPYIAACSDEEKKRISFEEVASLRPDGGINICSASVRRTEVGPPMYAESMEQFCGPCWNGLSDRITLWIIDSEWSERRITESYQEIAQRDLSLLERHFDGEFLSKEEYAYLAEQGYLEIRKGAGEECRAVLQALCIRDEAVKEQLLSIGRRIRERHRKEFEAWKETYCRAVLSETPKHLQKMQSYQLQGILGSDGWFILHCMKALVNQGKLKVPEEEQKRSLTTLLIFHGEQKNN